MHSEYGEGEYETGGRMEPLVALTCHGAVIGCKICDTFMVMKTDFLGGLYTEEWIRD